MNIDLSKGTIANILALGVGLLFFACLFFFPDGMSMFSSPKGYIFGVLLGFYLLPYMRIRETKRYKVETLQVIDAMAHLLKLEQATRPLARPAYDYFLRAIPNSEPIRKRVHDLGAQARLMFAVSRLFLLVAAMLVIAGLLKLSGIVFGSSHFDEVLRFAGTNPAVVILFCMVAVLLAAASAASFQRRGEGVVARQRNLERMTLLTNMDTVEKLRDAIQKNPDARKMLFFFKDVDDQPPADHVP